MPRLTRRLRFCVPLIFLVLCSAHGQTEVAPPGSPGSTLSVNVNIVAIDAVVHDKKGGLVRDLDKSSFTLKQDGKPQDIHYFSVDEDLPLTIGLLIDTSGSQQPFFEKESIASATFLRSVITKPLDRAFVVRFDTHILLLQKFTSDQQKLQTALGNLSTNYQGSVSHAGTLLFDAIAVTSRDILGKQTGRRALVVLTDGEDNGSNSTVREAIQEAQRADIAIYTVLYSLDPLGFIQFRNGPNGRATMNGISELTGGRVFAVDQDGTAEEIFSEIEQDLRSQYRLGYSPPPSVPGKYHRLELKTRTRGFAVQARSGYFTPPEASPPAKTSSIP